MTAFNQSELEILLGLVSAKRQALDHQAAALHAKDPSTFMPGRLEQLKQEAIELDALKGNLTVQYHREKAANERVGRMLLAAR
jgi:hypothetical protein